MTKKNKSKRSDQDLIFLGEEGRGIRLWRGTLKGRSLKIGVVASRFNLGITQALLSSALKVLRDNGVVKKNIEIAIVPGAFEIPLAIKRMAQTRRFQGIVALGAVIKGKTPHFHYISASVSQGLSNVALETRVPIGFGILTTHTLKQARERSDSSEYNRGGDAALAVLEMANFLKTIR